MIVLDANTILRCILQDDKDTADLFKMEDRRRKGQFYCKEFL